MNLDHLDGPFETERFVLRLLDASDLDGLFAVHGDEVVTRYLPSATWHDRHDAEAWLARHRAMHDERRVRRWVVVDKADDRPIGDCMLFHFDAMAARAELGFVLGHRDWGRGAMREAVTAVLAQGFDVLGLRRVEAFADPRNAPSHRLLHALAFVHEGTFRQRVLIKGEVCDSAVFGLLRDDRAAAR